MLKSIIAKLLSGVHAGEKHLAWNAPGAAEAPESITLTSSDFQAGSEIPLKFAGEGAGENISPSLSWSNIPAETKELVLILEDPDAPMPKPYVHLIVTGIAPTMSGLATGALSGDASALGLSFGQGTLGRTGYRGPRAPKGGGKHRYMFEIFALNKTLQFSAPPSMAELQKNLDGCIAKGRLTGLFEQKA